VWNYFLIYIRISIFNLCMISIDIHWYSLYIFFARYWESNNLNDITLLSIVIKRNAGIEKTCTRMEKNLLYSLFMIILILLYQLKIVSFEFRNFEFNSFHSSVNEWIQMNEFWYSYKKCCWNNDREEVEKYVCEGRIWRIRRLRKYTNYKES
jgi:hypothetical protein